MQRLRTGDPGQDNKRVRTSTADAAQTNGLRTALDFLAVLKKKLVATKCSLLRRARSYKLTLALRNLATIRSR